MIFETFKDLIRTLVVLIICFCVLPSECEILVESETKNATTDESWITFKKNFNKTYESVTEENLRFQIFIENREKISSGNFLFKLGVNEFTDMTFDEFREMHELDMAEFENETIYPNVLKVPYTQTIFIPDEDFDLPKNFDWRELGAVTKVENQKKCGSCYAMTSVAAIESQYFIQTGNLKTFSKQEILDCGLEHHAYGCDGGIRFRVYDYVKDKGGLSLAADYPYVAAKSNCKLGNITIVPIPVKKYLEIPSFDENALMQALVSIGPVAVSFDTRHETYMRYESGIFQDENCSNNTNHESLLVGYGTENGTNFWIVKNTFGEKWGENGYIRVIRDSKLSCGIGSYPFVPVLEFE